MRSETCWASRVEIQHTIDIPVDGQYELRIVGDDREATTMFDLPYLDYTPPFIGVSLIPCGVNTSGFMGTPVHGTPRRAELKAGRHSLRLLGLAVHVHAQAPPCWPVTQLERPAVEVRHGALQRRRRGRQGRVLGREQMLAWRLCGRAVPSGISSTAPPVKSPGPDSCLDKAPGRL